MSNYEKYKEKIKQTAADWLADHQEVRLYHCVKQRAKLSNLEFNLDIKDIRIPEMCPILGTPLTNIMGKGRQNSNASVDRINLNYGYVKGNIWIISVLANKMKNTATRDQLVQFANGILTLYT